MARLLPLAVFLSAPGENYIFHLCYQNMCFVYCAELLLGLRCYSDHSGPNSAGGVEVCDEGGVCSSSRIIFREEGVLRTAMSRHCVARTPERGSVWQGETEWPWCHEEWAGGDEGGMEVFTCYCKLFMSGVPTVKSHLYFLQVERSFVTVTGSCCRGSMSGSR